MAYARMIGVMCYKYLFLFILFSKTASFKFLTECSSEKNCSKTERIPCSLTLQTASRPWESSSSIYSGKFEAPTEDIKYVFVDSSRICCVSLSLSWKRPKVYAKNETFIGFQLQIICMTDTCTNYRESAYFDIGPKANWTEKDYDLEYKFNCFKPLWGKYTLKLFSFRRTPDGKKFEDSMWSHTYSFYKELDYVNGKCVEKKHVAKQPASTVAKQPASTVAKQPASTTEVHTSDTKIFTSDFPTQKSDKEDSNKNNMIILIIGISTGLILVLILISVILVYRKCKDPRNDGYTLVSQQEPIDNDFQDSSRFARTSDITNVEHEEQEDSGIDSYNPEDPKTCAKSVYTLDSGEL